MGREMMAMIMMGREEGSSEGVVDEVKKGGHESEDEEVEERTALWMGKVGVAGEKGGGERKGCRVEGAGAAVADHGLRHGRCYCCCILRSRSRENNIIFVIK